MPPIIAKSNDLLKDLAEEISWNRYWIPRILRPFVAADAPIHNRTFFQSFAGDNMEEREKRLEREKEADAEFKDLSDTPLIYSKCVPLT